MFEKASRLKLRFLYRGSISAEDLWDISLAALDSMFKGLNRLDQDEESLLDAEDKDDTLTSKIEIIRHVVKVRLRERDDAENKKARADRKQQLLAILAEKQDDSLRSMSIKDITELIDEL